MITDGPPSLPDGHAHAARCLARRGYELHRRSSHPVLWKAAHIQYSGKTSVPRRQAEDTELQPETGANTHVEAGPGTGPIGSQGKPHLFLTLDALRGVAALAVIAFHGWSIVLPLRFPSGYLAVDFFFMLSGFVLSFAYQSKLDAGWSTWSYTKTRLVRLYPLYLMGLSFGVILFLVLHAYRHLPLLSDHLVPRFVLGLLILPVMSLRPFSGTVAFPLNYPSWSIFFELLVNIGHALFLRRRSTRFLFAVAAVSLVGILGYTRRTATINLGLQSPENVLCLFRVLFSYTLGMLLFRIWRSGRIRVRVPPVLIAAVLLGTLALPLAGWTVLWELLIVTLLFPTLIAFAATVEPGPRWARPFRLLGLVSYAVYILHGPLLSTMEELWPHLRHRSPEASAPWDGLIFIAFMFLFALLVDRFYDLPVRAFLRTRLLARRSTTVRTAEPG